MIYHANEGPNAGCKATRSPRVQRMTWTKDGLPVFPVPTRTGTKLPAPKP